MKQSEALDMITKIQLAHQAMESACKRIDELKEENKNLKEALAKQEQHTLSSRVNDVRVHIEHGKQHDEAMKRITAKQEQGEPVAYLCENAVGHKYFRWKKPPSTYKPIALYATPQQRTWVGLTEDEKECLEIIGGKADRMLAEEVEAKLKEKNT